MQTYNYSKTSPFEWHHDFGHSLKDACDPNRQIQTECYGYWCTNCFKIDMLLGKIEYLTIAPTTRFIYFGETSELIEVGLRAEHINMGEQSTTIRIGIEANHVNIGQSSDTIRIGTDCTHINIGDNSDTISIATNCPKVDIGATDHYINVHPLYINTDGHIIPMLNNRYDLGKINRKIRHGYFVHLWSHYHHGAWGGAGGKYSNESWENIKNNHWDEYTSMLNTHYNHQNYNGGNRNVIDHVSPVQDSFNDLYSEHTTKKENWGYPFN